jgi:hypothetical protein
MRAAVPWIRREATGAGARRAVPATATAILAAALASILTPGCALPYREPNPSFAVPHAEAASDLRRMAESPVQLDRPVIVLAGIGDPAVSSAAIIAALRPCLAGPLVEVDFFDEHQLRQRKLRLLSREGVHFDTAGKLADPARLWRWIGSPSEPTPDSRHSGSDRM